MDYPDDPWNTPDLHKNHNHPPVREPSNGADEPARTPIVNGNGLYGTTDGASGLPPRTTSTFTTGGSIRQSTEIAPTTSAAGSGGGDGWGDFGGAENSQASAGSYDDPSSDPPVTSPFGAGPPGRGRGDDDPSGIPPAQTPSRRIGSGRTGGAIEENVLVTLMPEKEGMFMFQHHNYEVTSSRRGSKVVRRYSDFVWLLDCLHKRYPFRVLPLLPPKRVAGKD
jgi:sorting nexin-8